MLQEALKVLRLIDDKIIYKLNKSIPTDSFVGQVNAEQKCQELYNEVVMLCFLLVFIYLFELIIYLILPLLINESIKCTGVIALTESEKSLNSFI